MSLAHWAIIKLGGFKNGSDKTFNIGPDFIKNLVMLVTALIAFATWLSTTIAAPVQINYLKGDMEMHKASNVAQFQEVKLKSAQMSEKVDLIYADTRDIKNILMSNQTNYRANDRR
jgi:Na+/alanine symporter